MAAPQPGLDVVGLIGLNRLRSLSIGQAHEVSMSFVPVAESDEIPEGRGLRVRVGDIDVGLYRVDGQVFAMEDNCPHAGFPLSKGQLEGCVIVCEAHGWPFDVRTGFDPENADGFPVPCFAVSIRGATVHVDIDKRTNEPRRKRAPEEGTTRAD